MSDPVETAAPVAPAVVPVVAPAPAVTQAAPASAPATSGESKHAKIVLDDNPVWLSERLKREKLSALRAVGAKVGKNADPDAVAAEIKAKNDDRKGKLKAARADLEVANAKAAQLEQSSAAATATLKVYAETELSALTDKQREFVKLTAGDDLGRQLDTISMLKSQGVLTAQAAPPPAAPAAVPVVPATQAAPATIDAPASTSPASPAPTPASPQATDIRAEYRNLKSVSPYLAAQFILNHPELLNPS